MNIISISMLSVCEFSPVMGFSTFDIVRPIWRSAILALSLTVAKSITQTYPSARPYMISVAINIKTATIDAVDGRGRTGRTAAKKTATSTVRAILMRFGMEVQLKMGATT